ncbi:DUF3037 domain-containing protein [Mucilaginibacter sp. KACC 22773]|uniref:DUF3037 domain-containing protein n=1 Tax=Mucilaginibacter sp. KACC 22773 TaxID=3025671 RepID=UPI002366A3AB|nr:DUF3037 domain-containing protein [Mucilaginibacter sp. KACC 22773]WDF75367.1 DUF3037 domain-containing protein [Mucilaginibacter sp. KACC 22773]
MPDQLFEYAVIRVVPRVEREEFVNIGVILYCPKQQFLKAIVSIDEARIATFAPGLDIDCLKDNVKSFEKIAHGAPDAGPIAKLDIASRFRWLTATRSTVVQSSKVHPGLCTDAELTLRRLFIQLVG